jgi:hypothetical protein
MKYVVGDKEFTDYGEAQKYEEQLNAEKANAQKEKVDLLTNCLKGITVKKDNNTYTVCAISKRDNTNLVPLALAQEFFGKQIVLGRDYSDLVAKKRYEVSNITKKDIAKVGKAILDADIDDIECMNRVLNTYNVDTEIGKIILYVDTELKQVMFNNKSAENAQLDTLSDFFGTILGILD